MSNTADFTTEVSTIRHPTKISSLEGVYVNSVLTWPQLADVARKMSGAGIALPPHCRGEPELCFAICSKAVAWKVEDPFYLAEHSYVVMQNMRNRDGGWERVERLAYDSAIYQYALIRSGAIVGRPHYQWDGEGGDRTCTVQVLDRQTNVWQSLTSQPLKKTHPGHNDKGNVKGSPLWDTDPDQQQGYHTLRKLVRLMFQDVLGGFYDRYEFEETPEIKGPSSPNLLERLPGRMEGDGFKPTHGEEAAQEQAALSQAKAEGEEKKARRKRRTKAEVEAARKENPYAASAKLAQGVVEELHREAEAAAERQGSPLALPEAKA